MTHMLDTNIIAYAINKRPEQVLKKLLSFHPSDLCISAITMAELEFGVCKSARPEQNRLALLLFLSEIQILPFDSYAAESYGLIRQHLQSQGTLIGANDMLIAAHAKSQNLILVTNNTQEFERVPGLKLENWV